MQLLSILHQGRKKKKEEEQQKSVMLMISVCYRLGIFILVS